MEKLLERNVASIGARLVVLAPPGAGARAAQFTNLVFNSERRDRFVAEMQALRGSVYLHEGNVRPHELSADGRHQTPEDERSWHLLLLDPQGRVGSCAWYLEHEHVTSVHDLRVGHCPLAMVAEWSDRLEGAVRNELDDARRERLRYAEVGGWAVAPHRRCTSDALVLALATYSLSRMLGGALAITTANVRHSSASILRRLGGAHLEHEGTPMPTYFDPQYNTEIELLRFDSRRVSARYAGMIETLTGRLRAVPVLASSLDYMPVGVYATARAHSYAV